MAAQTFRTKVDLWFPAVLVLVVLRLLWPVPGRLLAGGPIPWPNLLVTALLLGLYVLLIRQIRYDVDDEVLRVRAPLANAVVPIASIYKLRRTFTLLAAPALSHDRIEVLARRGPYVVISPADKQAFIRAIRERNPKVELEGLG